VYDITPPPYGAITRRWSHLSTFEQNRHARRLLGVGAVPASIEQPDGDTAGHYQRLVTAATDGDEIAFAWLATSHRPLLIARGRILFEDDPAEWGAVCLELLHTTLHTVNPAAGRWLRRSVALRLANEITRAVGAHLDHQRLERPTDPTLGYEPRPRTFSESADPHPDLSLALDEVLDGLDPAIRDGLHAVADRQPLADVAEQHRLSHDALRQRLTRARRRLRPQLAAYHRAGV
jgi:hypothetical protein